MPPLRFRAVKNGFETLEAEFSPNTLTLDAVGTVPPRMVRVVGATVTFAGGRAALPDFWLDKYEVTNREFKQFVDAGGYARREYWKQPFLKGGRELTWDEAVTEFRDSTGRPGPATWELGTYLEGRAEFPVNGVSWYEAAAYAQFAGKALPTIYHWHRASASGPGTQVHKANFAGAGVAAVGTYEGIGPFGTFDMAGNVREWSWNATGERRYILGGAWNEPAYMYRSNDAQPPFDRSSKNGFRCAKYIMPAPAESLQPIERLLRDYSKEKPAGDEVFRAYSNVYSYDRGELAARLEATDEKSLLWRRERVSFNAAYGNERVVTYLFVPRNSRPPYQTVVYFPGAYALNLRSIDDAPMRWLEFVVRGGRALAYPIYKDTYERRNPPGPRGRNYNRDRTIQWAKDLSRTIDYLETRADIDRQKLAYYGMSLGAWYGPILTAVETRFRTGVFLVGGLPLWTQPAENDPLNFAPRVKMPVLMVGGRDDFLFPLETSQQPLLRLRGAPEKDKRLFLFEGGHMPAQMNDIIRETLDWLDRYLGPVTRQ